MNEPHSDLAPYPCPPLDEVFDQLAFEDGVGESRRFLFRQALGLWAKLSGARRCRDRQREEVAELKNPFVRPDLPVQSVFFPEKSFTVLMDDGVNGAMTRVPLQVTARLTAALLEYYVRVRDGKLEDEYEAAKRQDQSGYAHLFGRAQLFERRKTRVWRYVESFPSRHVIVGVSGVPYRLTVVDDDGRVCDAESLYRQLQAIVRHAAPATADHVFMGTVWTFLNEKGFSLIDSMFASQAGREQWEAISKPLFRVNLDLASHPTTLEELARSVHVENYTNRDYRQATQLVVTANGRAGMVFSFVAGVDGTVGANCVSWIVRRAQEISLGDDLPPEHAPQFEPIRLRHTEIPRKIIAKLNAAVKSRIYPPNQSTVFVLETVGRQALHDAGLSPDAVIQAALHSAYARCAGKIPRVVCFANLRGFRFGRVFQFCSSTSEMKQLVQAPTRENLLWAIEAHRREIRRIKSGNHPVYQLYTLLLGWKQIPMWVLASLLCLIAMFRPKLTFKYVRPHIWSSQIPPLDGIALTGRPGVRLGFIGRRVIAGHYLIYGDQIRINFVGRTFKFDHTKFAQELESALVELIALGREQEEMVSMTA